VDDSSPGRSLCVSPKCQVPTMTPTTVPLGCLPPNTVFGMAPPPCRWAIILSVATFKACPVRPGQTRRLDLCGRFRSSPINRHRQTGPVSLVPKHKTGSSTSIGRDSNDLSIVTNALGLDFFRVRFRRILSFRFTDSVAEGRDALCRIASRP
jgi:hypothetical protein